MRYDICACKEKRRKKTRNFEVYYNLNLNSLENQRGVRAAEAERVRQGVRDFLFLATCDKINTCQDSDGLSRFKVGGIMLSVMALIEKMASDRSGSTEQVTDRGFRRGMETVLAASPSIRLTAPNSISSPTGVEVPCALM